MFQVEMPVWQGDASITIFMTSATQSCYYCWFKNPKTLAFERLDLSR